MKEKNNTIWHSIEDSRITKDEFIAVIEIAKGTRKKYELDKETGLIILDRVLHSSVFYPANYGFIPKTVSEDGDPLDVLVLSSESFDPLVLVKCYPIGMVTMLDNGEKDEKIIAIPVNDPLYNEYESIRNLPTHILDELVYFFKIYKDLEDKITKVSEPEGVESAKQAIVNAKQRYVDVFGK